MRRRQQERSAGDPGTLLRFRASEWPSGEPETPPDHWPADDWRGWHTIQAFKRYLAAVQAWRAEHGVSFEEWQAMKRRGVGS